MVLSSRKLDYKNGGVRPSLRLLFPLRLAVLSAVLAAALFGASLFNAEPVQAQDNAGAIAASPTTYLVRFQAHVGEAERAAWLASHGAELVSWLPQINVAEVRFTAGGEGEMAAGLAAAGADQAVVYVEPDVAVSGDRVITEPAFNNADQSYAQQLLRLPAALDFTEGDAAIVIAIVDSGVNPDHPEFAGRLVAGYDYVNNDADPRDDHGHGTHVAGIAAAGLNGVGTAGICPQCKIMPVKVLNATNGGTWSLVAKGILFAVDNGARVINLSLGATINTTTLQSAIDYAEAHGVIVVAAAGNMGREVNFYPAAIPYVIAVSGTDRSDGRWSQSNYGSFVDVAAPAVSIYSAYHSSYATMSGTSMASPFVTGLAALVLSRQPKLKPAQVLDLIAGNAIDLGPTGHDKEYGHGRIDAYATMLAANGGNTPEPKTPPQGGAVSAKLYLPNIQVKQ
jgi:subtilisin family serine protease